MKIGVVHNTSIFVDSNRIDPSFHLNDALVYNRTLKNTPFELLPIRDVVDRVFLGNIFSRTFVTKGNGVPYLSASDTVLQDLDTGRYLAQKQVDKLHYLMLDKDWILVTCSGTLGKITYTNDTFKDYIATHDLIRVIPSNDKSVLGGVVYAFLSGKYGNTQLTRSKFGGVVKHINADHVESVLIPKFAKDFQQEVDSLVKESAQLRSDATELLKEAEKVLKTEAGLRNLTTDDYDYFGSRTYKRQVSCFVRERKDVNVVTINAFNHSERIRNTKQMISCTTLPLKDVLLNGDVFSTGSFPRVEVKGENGVMLINQSDIFDTIIKGKCISKRNVRLSNLVEYGEVLIAGVGTLGENESFCRVIYANEGLVNQLVSGEFIRMKTDTVPSGYLFAWLNTDYGFRFIRNTQAGTKLCRPIPKLLLEIPVPIIAKDKMEEIDRMVREAHTMRYQANQKELKAIAMVEAEIEKWKN